MTTELALLLMAVATLGLTAIAYRAAGHLKNATLRRAIDMGCQSAGALAYYVLLHDSPGGLPPSVALARAIETGLEHMRHSLPDTLAAMGVDEATLTAKIKGALAALLAADPAISPAVLQPTPAAVPAPVP